MVLSEVLKGLSNEQKIKIAAKNGSSFFFVGEVNDLIQNMPAYNEACFKHARRKAKHKANVLAEMIQSPPTMERYFQENYLSDTGMTVDDYLEFCRLYFEKYKSAKEASVSEHERYKNYVSLADREVVDQFEADPSVEENTIVIYVDGYELGAYWSFDEVKDDPFRLNSSNIF